VGAVIGLVSGTAGNGGRHDDCKPLYSRRLLRGRHRGVDAMLSLLFSPLTSLSGITPPSRSYLKFISKYIIHGEKNQLKEKFGGQAL
jgi:hypothetical protein